LTNGVRGEKRPARRENLSSRADAFGDEPTQYDRFNCAMQHKLCAAFKPLIKKRRRALYSPARGYFGAGRAISAHIAFVVAADDISRSQPASVAVGAIARQPTGSRPMTAHINDMMEKIRQLEAELDAEIAQRRIELHVGMEKGRIFFEQEILRRHRELRTRLSTYILNARPLALLTAPVIYAMIAPFVLLDIFVTNKPAD
jgi:hypothetical protein